MAGSAALSQPETKLSPIDRALLWAADAAADKPKSVLLAVGLVTLASLAIASGLRVSTSRTALISENDPVWHRYMLFSEEFGIPEDLIVVLRGSDPKEVRKAADDVATRVKSIDSQVASVFYRVDLGAFRGRAALFLPEETSGLLAALAREPSLAELRNAKDPGARIEGLAKIFGSAPSLYQGDVPADTSALGNVLNALLGGLGRAARGEEGLTLEQALADPKLFAKGDLGTGLDPEGYLSFRGGTIALVTVRPKYRANEIALVAPFVEEVRKGCNEVLAHHPGVTMAMTGVPASQVEEYNALGSDNLITTAIAYVLVVFAFVLYFPSFRLLLFSLAPVFIGSVWTAAAARLVYGYLNFISSVFFVVVVGMGTDYSIHIAGRFLEARASGFEPREAARLAVMRTGRGILTGCLTSAGAFAAVGFSDFKGMAELGVTAAIGLVLTTVVGLTILPALLVLKGPPALRPPGLPGSERVVKHLVHHRNRLAIVALVITPIAAWLGTRTRFDFDLSNLLPAKSESARLMIELPDELQANTTVAIAPDLEAARKMEAQLRALPSVARTLSAAAFIPPRQDVRLAKLSTIAASLAETRAKTPEPEPVPVEKALGDLATQIERLQEFALRRGDSASVALLETGMEEVEKAKEALAQPGAAERVAAYTEKLAALVEAAVGGLENTIKNGPMTPADLPAGVRERFVSAKGRYAIYVFPKESVWDRDKLERFVREGRSVTPELTGFAETFYENTGTMRRGFLQAAVYSFLIVFLLLFLDFRNIKDTALSMTPSVMAAGWMLGTMGLFGVPYNLANIVALPLIIGAGIDYPVHLVHRYHEDRKLAETIRFSGGAIFSSALMTMCGFGSLVLASHRGLSSLGAVLLIGIGCCLLTTLLLLPAGLDRLLPPPPDQPAEGAELPLTDDGT